MMELTELKQKIMDTFSGNTTDLEDILNLIEQDNAVFPFNEYEHMICSCIEKGGLTYQQYIDIREEYIFANPNLWIFEISAPRTFGEKFAQTYIKAKSQLLQSPNKKLDADYSGQYDLWLDGIRIEVKASRVVNRNSDEPLYIKALSRNTKQAFLMNFQQLKPECCDVFIWLAVFRDCMKIWIMNSNEVSTHPYYSKGQHRGNHGNEGQLHLTNENLHEFDKYELNDDNIVAAIRLAHSRNQTKA